MKTVKSNTKEDKDNTKQIKYRETYQFFIAKEDGKQVPDRPSVPLPCERRDARMRRISAFIMHRIFS